MSALIMGRPDIFGAGANGFDHRIPHLLDNLGIDRGSYVRLRVGLQRVAPRSIDSLLESRTDLLDVGKVALACALLPRERSTADTLFPSSGDWIGYLFNRVIGSNFEGARERISFVTFNYDRLLEHRLTQYIAATLQVDLQAAWELAQTFEIIHVYGQLGPYSPDAEEGRVHWPILDMGDNLAHTVLADESRVRLAVEGIRLVHERQDRTDNVRRAQRAVASASLLWFLGFGYDHTNLSRLRATLGSRTTGSPVFGSTLGLYPGEVKLARAAISKFINQTSGQISAAAHHLENADCLGTLRIHADHLR